MRDIKFRGRHKTTDCWYYGYFNMRSDGSAWIDKPDKFNKNVNEHYNVMLKTVGEFTGLRDGNGEEIYEGDILSYDYAANDGWPAEYRYWEVGYDVNESGFAARPLGSVGPYTNAITDLLEDAHTVVCGNIHDDPVLAYKQ